MHGLRRALPSPTILEAKCPASWFEPVAKRPELNEDFIDALCCLQEAAVEFVIVGAHALAAHGIARATGDIDIFVRPSAENAARVMAALTAFGAPLAAHQVGEADFSEPGTVYQIGLPPRRIDLLTEISGVSFDEAWTSRLDAAVAGMQLPFLGKDALVKNKLAAGRDKDLIDAKALSRAKS
jgi:hypothetical protein